MQKYLYLIVTSLCLISCYTYQVKKPVDMAMDNKQEAKNSTSVANNANFTQKNVQQTPAPISIQEKLTANKNVKIDVDGKSYKIIVDRWESDSLVAHPPHQPKTVLKFHKNQINGEKIAEKRFSQPIADIITVAAYAGAGIAIWSLLQ